MKLPRGAFIFRGSRGDAIDVTSAGAEIVGLDLYHSDRFFGDDEWCVASAHNLTRGEARKLIRKLVKAIEATEAFERGEKIVRKGRGK